MTEERYFQWMKVWECIAAGNASPQMERLHSLINVLWQEDRVNSSPEELASHAGAWTLENIDFASDPDYQAFKREMDRTFGSEPN